MENRLPFVLAALSALVAGCGSQPAYVPAGGMPNTGMASLSSFAAPAPGGMPMAPNSGAAPSASAIRLNVKNFAEVSPTLYRGGRPDESLLRSMKAQGIKSDVCLMGAIPGFDTALDFVEHEEANHAGVKWINVKVPMTGVIPQSIADQFFQAVLDPANQPAYVHCMYGRDRTGVMVALYRIRMDHYTNQQALAEAESFGYSPTRFTALTKFLLSYSPTP